MGFTPLHVFDSTMCNTSEGLLLLMALSTLVSLINRLFSLPFPGLDLRGSDKDSRVQVRLRPLYLNAYVFMTMMNHVIIK